MLKRDLVGSVQGRVRSLAIAWEQAKTALQERQQQSSGRSTPRTSPRDSAPDSHTASPSGSGQPPPPLPPLPAPGAAEQAADPQRVIRHARSISSPQISPCDSAYDAGGTLRQQQSRGASPRGGGSSDAYNVSPRPHSEVYTSPRKAGLEQAAASDGVDRYHRHPPVSSVGLAKLQVRYPLTVFSLSTLFVSLGVQTEKRFGMKIATIGNQLAEVCQLRLIFLQQKLVKHILDARQSDACRLCLRCSGSESRRG